MKNTDTSQLPPAIEKQLSDLETRHRRHQEKMQTQHDRKHDAREKHRARKYERKMIPILL